MCMICAIKEKIEFFYVFVTFSAVLQIVFEDVLLMKPKVESSEKD